MLIDDKVFYEIWVDTFLEGICITDDKGIIVMNNTPLEEIFGYKKGELLHKKFDVLIPEKFRKIHLNHFSQYFKNPIKFKKGHGREVYGLHKSGKILHVEIGLNSFEYHGRMYAKALISDISLRKDKEQKINRLNFELEQEVLHQTKELTHVVSKLKKSNKKLKLEIDKKILAENIAKNAFQKEKELNLLQTKFLSLASHEFKTPLSGILTSTTLIDKYNEVEKNTNIENHVRKIKKLVGQFNSVLDDFLFLERTETKNVNYYFSSFNFCKFFNRIINNSKTVLKSGQNIVFLSSNDQFEVYQDRKIIDIIFRNIIYNAIKYSPKNSLVNIEVKINDFVTVTIEDSGIGIPQEDQKHVFERFFRAKNALHFQGTGIGLNIVKHHIEALGGSIKFKSIENKGSKFVVKLPREMSVLEVNAN